MPVQQIKDFLEQAGVDYSSLTHPPAMTARQRVQVAPIIGEQMAKAVVIDLDGKPAMLVMPATWRVKWERLSGVLDTDFVELADEEEFLHLFPGCEAGALPPFGNLFGMTVYCSEALTEQADIAFSAGSLTESLTMKTKDFLALVHPVVIRQGFIRPGAPKPSWLKNAKPRHLRPSNERRAMPGY
ncbi:aminoacyl-tRNA deacylase [Marinobacter sp. X15-166B]|uniref:aminoacyl-tRNA deacylase n=1 Tax=Marinobacter sp. X15-166B TaxID=1897620 RepID=UPI00085C0052|nr:YbaK/EbsC family protein [Marinobacter sp. X15-166B]OEY65779.1 deacylase [Marinobacter sp. X15-166B]